MFCSTVSHGKSPPCWKTYPLLGDGPVILSPSKSSSPDCGTSSPAMSLSSVVFPQPDAPIMETNSPFSTERLTSLNASTSFSSSL